MRDRAARAIAALLVALSGVGATALGCGRAIRPDVLLVTLDTTRADRLHCYGNARIETPALDGLARTGVLFERAYTAIPSTLPSHAAILTGLYPASLGLHDNGIYALADPHATLAERLRAAGYETGAFVSAFVLDHRFGLARGFDVYDDAMVSPLAHASDASKPGAAPALPDAARGWLARMAEPFERRASETTAHAIAWVAARGEAPVFAWVHYFDAHQPYQPPPPWNERYDPGYAGPMDGDRARYHALMRERNWTRHTPEARREIDHLIALYDGELSYVDGELAKLLDAFARRGRPTLVVVVGDHGESFGEHVQIFEHNQEIYEEVTRVPLLVRLPDGASAGRRVDALVRTIDLAPTVLDWVGLAAAPEIEGRSLRPELLGREAAPPRDALVEARRSRQLFAADHSLLGLRRGDWAAVLALDPADRVLRRELYDLASDPRELRSLASAEPATIDALDAAIRALVPPPGASADGAERALDPQTEAALRALGYLDGK